MVAPDGLREDLASSYLIELLPQAPAAWETQVRKAVRRTLEHATPSCLRVLDALLARSGHPDARAAGEALSVWADSGVARLGVRRRHERADRGRAAGDDDQGARAVASRRRACRAPTTTRPSGSAWRR